MSASFDEATWGPVAVELKRRGLDVVVFESDRIARGETALTISQDGADVHVRIAEHEFAMNEVAAAWWRKPHWLSLPSGDRLRKQALEHEVNRLQQSSWGLLAEGVWLNSPVAMRASGSLSVQLAAAARCGFETPKTLVSNDWSEVTGWAAGQDLALKTLNGFFESDSQPSRNLFTQRVTDEELAALRETALPYPAVFQPFISKRREWRVTVVAQQVFAVTVYTSGAGQVDWRSEQGTDQVRFVAERLPAAVEHQCRSVIRDLGLRFAAIDLIETDNGRHVFLEANPNGQYSWLENQVGYEISQAVALALVELATSNTNRATPVTSSRSVERPTQGD